jgi:hypothetical protein
VVKKHALRKGNKKPSTSKKPTSIPPPPVSNKEAVMIQKLADLKAKLGKLDTSKEPDGFASDSESENPNPKGKKTYTTSTVDADTSEFLEDWEYICGRLGEFPEDEEGEE